MDSAFDIAFNHVQDEQALVKLSSSGDIPKWINGSLYRNGPGLFSTTKVTFKHWFDGLAMVHRFIIRNGEVHYQSKYLDTNTKDSLVNRDEISYPEFATDPCGSIFNKYKSWYSLVNPKVNLTEVGNRFIALGETMLQLEIDKNSLESIGVHNYNNFKYTPGVTTAHPHVDQDRLYNMVLKMGVLNFYDIIEYNVESKNAKSICKIPIQNPAYIHSIGMSENYFILAHFPFECTSIDFVLKKKPFVENFKWFEKKKSRLWIVSRNSGEVIKKLKVDPFFSFHFINAFEENGKLVFDLCNYKNAKVVHSFYMKNLADLNEELAGAKIERFSYNFSTQLLSRDVLCEEAVELVTFDDRLIRKDYNYVYGLGISNQGSQQFYDQLVKINVKTGDYIIWRDPDYYPGEPKFIPYPNGGEDEGVILSILINIKDKAKGSKLLFLDAKTFRELASCHTAHNIIPGFHNYFLS